MPQAHDMAEKVRVLVDGVEIPGLTKWPGIERIIGTIEVPEFAKKRNITDGIEKMPLLELTYKTARDTNTLTFFTSWYENKESHDVTVIKCDATGKEYARRLLTNVECNKCNDAPFDAAAPTYASIVVGLVPFDILVVAAEV